MNYILFCFVSKIPALSGAERQVPDHLGTSVRGLYGKVFAWGFRTDRARSVQKKTEGKYFPVQTEQTRLIRHSLYGFWFIFFSVYSAVLVFRCWRLPYLWVSWFRFMFTLVRHSFASLIDKQLSRKATLMFWDVLLFELFQRTLPNPFFILI